MANIDHLNDAAALAYAELKSTRCCCGGRKASGKSFCWKCWCLLPKSIQSRLYDENGYPQAVADAKARLTAKGRITASMF